MNDVELKQRIKTLALYKGISLEEASEIYSHGIAVSDDTREDTKSENPLLDVIYAVNPDTGLPQGDVAFYLSKNCSPELRQFINDNLMRPIQPLEGLPADKQDDLFDYIRNENETRYEYAARVTKLQREKVVKLTNKE